MIKYLLIPILLEETLFTFRGYWLSQSEESYMVITGHYNLVDNQKEEDYSTIRNQVGNLIPYKILGITEIFGGSEITKYLNSFIVEAKVEDVPNDLDNTIIVFNSGNELLDYLYG